MICVVGMSQLANVDGRSWDDKGSEEGTMGIIGDILRRSKSALWDIPRRWDDGMIWDIPRRSKRSHEISGGDNVGHPNGGMG